MALGVGTIPQAALIFSLAGHYGSGLLNFAAPLPEDSRCDRKYRYAQLQMTQATSENRTDRRISCESDDQPLSRSVRASLESERPNRRIGRQWVGLAAWALRVHIVLFWPWCGPLRCRRGSG